MTTMRLESYLDYLDKQIDTVPDYIVHGKIIRISGVLLEATGLKVSIGSICAIHTPSSDKVIWAETIGFANQNTYLIAFEDPKGILPGTSIYLKDSVFKIPVGYQLMGRILDGYGRPIDNKGPLSTQEFSPVTSQAINPIHRKRIDKVLDVGVRAINSLLTVGIGQRMGIFSGSGVGKSMLLGMITRFTKADVVVIGLIGERGREVKEFIEENIGAEYLAKTVIVASPIDTSPLQLTNGVLTAVTIAEYFRDAGLNVLLIVDSLTRYAQALRKMYILLGEPVSSKGYSPSVFAKLSELAERCGYGASGEGCITAFFTVLVEADDMQDPVADHVRSVLDGHIVLSRALAEAAHYPPIDLSASISRVMSGIIDSKHYHMALHFKKLYAHYMQNHDLIKMGMYKSGTDKLLDEGIQLIDKLKKFAQQGYQDSVSLPDSLSQLEQVLVINE